VSFTKYYSSDEIKEDEMDGARSTRGRDENTKLWSENPKGRGHSEDRGIDRIILEWVGRCGLDSCNSG
jgi:hypothetical protein